MMTRMDYRLPLLSALVFIAFAVAAPPADAATAVKKPPYLRLFYYQDGKIARQSFLAHPGSVDVFAPQAYGITADGTLAGSVDQTLLDFAKKNKIKVMPLATNASFGKAAYQAVLDDPAKQEAVIAALVAEAKTNDYWGWQLDFEQMDASYKDKFSAFVVNADAAMKQNGLAFSVAVVAKTSDVPADYPNALWQNLIGVYDYAAIASSTDFVSVMSYDDPNSKGPVAGYAWLKQVIAYSVAHMPKKKISLGIPFYYWQWNDATGKLVGIGGNTGIDAAIKKHYIAYHYSAAEQAPYLTYWSRAQHYTIWYENAKSIAQKIALIKKNGLYGFSAWALGLEVPSVYGVMKK